MDDLVEVAKAIKGELAQLNKQHRDVMRVLIAVVCIIALGKGLIEVFHEVRDKAISTLQAEEK